MGRITGSFVAGGGVTLYLTESSPEAVRAKVKACILTPKGSVPSQPLLGSNATAFTFKPISQDGKAMLANVIQEDIVRCVPEIRSLTVMVDDTDDPNKVIVRVKYMYEGSASEAVVELGA